jgi:hypothetical protein
MLQWLYTYVASVYPNVLSIFLDVCCKCVYLDVAYVVYICCKCFMWMLRLFAMVFSSVFLCVLYAYFKCFICSLLYVISVGSRCFKCRLGCWTCCMVFQVCVLNVSSVLGYAVNVSSGCCKSRYSVAHVVVGPICRIPLEATGHVRACM